MRKSVFGVVLFLLALNANADLCMDSLKNAEAGLFEMQRLKDKFINNPTYENVIRTIKATDEVIDAEKGALQYCDLADEEIKEFNISINKLKQSNRTASLLITNKLRH